MSKKKSPKRIEDYLPYTEAAERHSRLQKDLAQAQEHLADVQAELEYQESPQAAQDLLATATSRRRAVSSLDMEGAQRKVRTLEEAVRIAKRDLDKARQDAQHQIRASVAEAHAALGDKIAAAAASIVALMDEAAELERSAGGFGAPMRRIIAPELYQIARQYTASTQRRAAS